MAAGPSICKFLRAPCFDAEAGSTAKLKSAAAVGAGLCRRSPFRDLNKPRIVGVFAQHARHPVLPKRGEAGLLGIVGLPSDRLEQ